MGVAGLAQLINDVSPSAICTDNVLKDYAGKKIAMDAYQYLYQAFAPRRSKKKILKSSVPDTSSPLMRTFFSCVRLLSNGIKPVFVFDGKPPKLKSEVLKERAEKRADAVTEFKVAESKGDTQAMEMIKPHTVKVGKTEVKDSRGLLNLMGIPCFFAPGEAEAQCAAFVRNGSVYATATQDIDALTYGTNVVLRYIPYNAASRYPIQEIRLENVLADMKLSLPEFIDLSIMLGCDYCKGIKGLGAHRAIELIHKHRTIENILDHLDTKKFIIPNKWLFKEAREVFLNPTVMNNDKEYEFKWKKPDEDGIVQYLRGESQFNEKKIRKIVKSISINSITESNIN